MSARWAATSRWPQRARGAHLTNVKGYAFASVSVSEFQSWRLSHFSSGASWARMIQGFISYLLQRSPLPATCQAPLFHDRKQGNGDWREWVYNLVLHGNRAVPQTWMNECWQLHILFSQVFEWVLTSSHVFLQNHAVFVWFQLVKKIHYAIVV